MKLPQIFKRNKKDDAKSPAQKKDIKRIFTNDYLLDITHFDKKLSNKEIESFIGSEVQNNFQTNDFYYGYIYENGYLKYVAHISNSYEVGNISKLSVVLLNEGDYYIHNDEQYFRFKHKDNEIEDTIEYDSAIEAETHGKHAIHNIDKAKIDKVPDTLVLQWSLHKKTFNITAILGAVFIISIITNLLYADKYKEISAKAEMLKKQYQAKQSMAAVEVLPDLSQSIRKLSTMLENRGTVTMATGDNKKMTFAIRFNAENDARTFIKNNGGSYENGKVVYSTPVLGNK